MEEQTHGTELSENIEPTFEESFQMLYAAAPKPIQKFLLEKKHEGVAISLAHTYKLNIDQTGILSQRLVFLLLGAQSPREFSESLIKEFGVTEKMSAQITNDVNRLVFIPLRKQIQQSNEPVQKTSYSNQSNVNSDKHTENTDTDSKSYINIQNASKEKTNITHAQMTPIAPPTPLHTPTPSSSPIVKEYSVDPYRESPE